MGFNHKQYVPILKGKRAEFASMTRLKSLNSITPLFEAIPSKPANTVPIELSKSGWPAECAYFADLLFFDSGTASPPLRAVLNCITQARAKGQNPILVTGTGRSPAYQNAAAQVVTEKSGVAIRLTPDDFEDEDRLELSLRALLSLFKLTRNSVDLIIDLGSIAGQKPSVVAQILRVDLGFLPAVSEWRTVTVASGAFPPSLAPLTRSTWNRVARVDWQAWVALVGGTRKMQRLPSYGDYTVSNTGLPPEGRATILAQLRYSTPTEFMIWKGHDVKRHPDGYRQFRAICQNIVGRPEYRGAGFSSGDQEIQEKATTPGSPGNPEAWRRIGTNHHIETVLDQFSNLP